MYFTNYQPYCPGYRQPYPQQHWQRPTHPQFPYGRAPMVYPPPQMGIPPNLFNSVGFHPYQPRYAPPVPQIPPQVAQPMMSQIMQSPTRNFQSPDRMRGATSPQRNVLMQSQQVPTSPQQLMQSPQRQYLTYDQVMERIKNPQQQSQQSQQSQQQLYQPPQVKAQQTPQQQQYQQGQKPNPIKKVQQAQPDDELDKRYQNALKSTEEIIKKYQVDDSGKKQREQSPPQDGNSQDPDPDQDQDFEGTDDNNELELALQYEDGYIYRGQGIPPQTRNGFGILTDAQSNEVYAGYWKDNFYHGQGRLTNLQQEPLEENLDWNNMTAIGNGWLTYEGNFVAGKMHGVGTLILTNNEKFVGEFEDGMVHGDGEFTTADNQVVKGSWDQGFMINVQE